MTFEECLPHILRQEGGWTDDPYDPGGPTNKGITIAVYAAWIRTALTTESRGRLIGELRVIPDETVANIYRFQYWDPVYGGELPAGVQLAVFDFAVNSGVARATRSLQKCLGCKADGHMGVATLSAVDQADPIDLVRKLCDERRRFLRQIPHFWRFGKGWLRRVDDIEAASIAAMHAATANGPAMLGIAALAPAEQPGESDARRSAKAPPIDGADSMLASKTGWAAILATLGGASAFMQSISEVGRGATEVARAAGDLHLTTGADPYRVGVSLLAIASIASGVFVWLERRRKQIAG